MKKLWEGLMFVGRCFFLALAALVVSGAIWMFGTLSILDALTRGIDFDRQSEASRARLQFEVTEALLSPPWRWGKYAAEAPPRPSPYQTWP